MSQFSLIAYSLGIFAVLGFPSVYSPIPETVGLFAVTVSAVLVLAIGFNSRPFVQRTLRRGLLLFWVFMLGFGWHMLWARAGLNGQLPLALEGKDIIVTGQVVSLPVSNSLATEYQYQIQASGSGYTGKVLLRDYSKGDSPVRAGELRTQVVRLNRPHGVANPGGFELEGQRLREGVKAVGYLRETHEVAPGRGLSLVKARQFVRDRLLSSAANSTGLGVMLALVLGDKSQLSPDQQQLFARTGTSHLFVISGLHVSLIAGIVYWLTNRALWLFPGVGLLLPRQKLATIFALAGAFAYGGLAGFTLPTVRAVVMLVALMGSYLANWQVPMSLRWLLALALVLTIDPLAPVSAGFWLSFLAVAALMLLMQTHYEAHSDSLLTTSLNSAPDPSISLDAALATAGNGARLNSPGSSWLKQIRLWTLPQFGVSAGLMLPLLIWGMPVSILSPLVNLVAIPIVGLVLVPASLGLTVLSLMGPAWVAWVLPVIEGLIAALLWGLGAVDNSVVAQHLAVRINPWNAGLFAWPLAALGILLFLYPLRGIRRLQGLILCLPLLSPLPIPPIQGMEIHVLDVGQGLAVVIRTPQHALLYDTGNGRQDGFSVGRSIIAPMLKRQGINGLDGVVVSHGDTDHAGGLNGLLAVIPTNMLISSVELITDDNKSQHCGDVSPWEWEQVKFEFLSTTQSYSSANNLSCVLRVSLGESSILLPGDIEQEAEIDLVLGYGDRLSSSVLLAPHHGSKSSSSYPFLKTVNPELVVFSAGRHNPFNHPEETISKRYQSLGIEGLTTANTGMISLKVRPVIDQSNEPGSGKRYEFTAPVSYRQAKPRYWRCPQTCR